MSDETRLALEYLDFQVKMMRDTISGHDASPDQIVVMFKYVDDQLREILND